jgi:general secretion pathway protein I
LFSGGLKAAKLADDYTRAVFHAREKMEEFLLKTRLEEGVYEGQFDDEYRWKIEIVLVVPEETEDPEVKPPPVDVFNLTVSVSWQSGDREKTFQVGTLQVAEKTDETI